MRIAVLVYGRLNRCVEHYENIVAAIGREHTLDWFMSSDAAPESLLNDFLRTYSPAAYTNKHIEYTCDLSKYAGKRPETNIDSMTRHFINKERVWSLFDTYVQCNSAAYDIVISLRVDVIFRTKFPLTVPAANTVYIPAGYDYVDRGINDQLAFGDMASMKKYNSVFETSLQLLNEMRSIPHPETLTLATLNYHRLHVHRVGLAYALNK
jgi:hypothetical protein